MTDRRRRHMPEPTEECSTSAYTHKNLRLMDDVNHYRGKWWGEKYWRRLKKFRYITNRELLEDVNSSFV